MRPVKIIFLWLAVFAGFDFYAQTPKDSLPFGADSLRLARPDTMGRAETTLFKPQYRPGILYLVTTNLDMTYTGFIVIETEFYIVVEDRRTQERSEIRKTEIKSAKVFSNQQSYATLLGENYHAGTYMLASSAFLFEGESISSTYHWFLFENLDYAITDNWAVSAGSLAFYPISLGLKCAFEIDENNFIGGSIFGFGDITANNGSFFLGYGGIAKYTRGTSNHNFTLGGGILGINSDFIYSTPSPVPFYNLYFSNLSYCSRLNEHVALNLEGWYFPQAQIGLAGIGFKLVKNKDAAWTFGCYSALNLLNNNISLNFKAVPIPYLGLTQKF